MQRQLIQMLGTLGLWFAAPVVAVAAPAVDADQARVAWHQVAAPQGKFLLVQGTEGTCAIRFLDLQRMNDAKPGTAFNSGAEHISARYEWHFLKQGQANFLGDGVKHGTGRVADGPLVGVGRMAFQTESPIVKCGPFKNFWLPAGSLSFSERVSCKAAKYQIAPTRWETIADIDLADSRLKWFACDPSRKNLQIPLTEL